MTYAENIFRAFERLPSGRQFKGIGLGLAIVSRIAARYGGTVWTESQAGRGATFFFTLPDAQEHARNETTCVIHKSFSKDAVSQNRIIAITAALVMRPA